MIVLEIIQSVAVIILFIVLIKQNKEIFDKNKEISSLQQELDTIKYTECQDDYSNSIKEVQTLNLLKTTLDKINRNYRINNNDKIVLFLFLIRCLSNLDNDDIIKPSIKIDLSKFDTYKLASEPLYKYIKTYDKMNSFELPDKVISELLSATYYLITKK